MNQPRLMQDLRIALACLYSLPPPPGSPETFHQLSLSQAQSFLIQLQSRNVRRKIASLEQRRRDQQQSAETHQQLDATGSSWLACISLLCQMPLDASQNANNTATACTSERLFAAQTLVHRVRKTTLTQAVDVEIEHQNEETIQQLSNTINLLELVDLYKQWMQHVHPLVGAIVMSYEIAPGTHNEERIKGELSLLTLAAIAYINACSQIQNKTDHYSGPLLNTLGSVMAATALRLRYNSESIDRHVVGPAPHSQPIVTMVTHALSVAHDIASKSNLSHFGNEASGLCLRACLAAIPDTLLTSPDGSNGGRLSIDPKCLQAANAELRATGISLVWGTLKQHQHQHQQPNHHTQGEVLLVCERWAKFLPLPLDFVHETIPIAIHCLSSAAENVRKAALAYLITIYEGGAWTFDQVLSFSLGLTSEQQQQVGKKRQTSKSKKKHKEMVDLFSTDSIMAQARAEVHHRGETACQVTVMVWETLRNILVSAPGDQESQGDGPIGCLAACANACLPHLLRNPSPKSKELFTSIFDTFQNICKSPSRYIRAFSYEPILTLHAAMLQLANDQVSIDAEYQEIVVEFFFQCSINLATACCYPPDYFNQMGASSDEEVESERNDVRDILRTVAGSGEGGSTSNAGSARPPLDISLQVLFRLLKSCGDSIFLSHENKELFHETAMHTLSALSKAFNQLAKSYTISHQKEFALEILKLVLKVLTVSMHILIEAYTSNSVESVFPISRVSNLAIASLSPMISSLCLDPHLHDEVVHLLNLSIQASALSLVHIPELTAPSELDQSQYDIRGAMRGPGGEDHVGCLTLMRMAYESDHLARTMVKANDSIAQQLCDLHGRLKSIETNRGRGIFHGEGVAPKSRRILLGIICHLEIVTEGQAGCASVLTDLFNSSILSINALSSSSAVDGEFMFRLCENTFDLASYPPVIVASLFSDANGEVPSFKSECIRALVNAGIYGYQQSSVGTDPSDLEFQWNRLRGSLFLLLRESAFPTDLSDVAAEAISTMNQAECDAVQKQCLAGPASSSSIFNDEIICPDTVPTGLFIRVVGEVIALCAIKNRGTNWALPNCIYALHKSMPCVLQTVTMSCSEPLNGFVDPRPTIWEAWLFAMNELIVIVRRGQEDQSSEKLVAERLVVDSCASALLLLFYPAKGKKRDERAQAPGMSLDGPHGLASVDFLISYFSLGPRMLRLLVKKLIGILPVSLEGEGTRGVDDMEYACGVSIIGAALYRAAEGSLPPWAVESTPAVYAALFNALQSDPNWFRLMLEMSMEIRLAPSASKFGSVEPGHLLSGRLFETLSNKAKELFIKQAFELCQQNTTAGWKRLKVLVKQLSGGKKKDTDFKQKPALTKWEFERI